MNVAAVQFSPVRGEVARNLHILEELTRNVSTELLVLPELASTGYFFTDRDELAALAEAPEKGSFCKWMRDFSERNRTVVVGGFAELGENGALYNSALVSLPDGRFQVYRKVHLFYKEREVFEPGNEGFFVVEWNTVRIGTMICYDWRFPESTRVLALNGAEIIAHPSDLVAAKALWGPTLRTRAFENKVIIVTANRNGEESVGGETLRFTGASQITNMNGAVISEAGPEDVVVIHAEVEPSATRNKAFSEYNDIMNDRRPELYGALSGSGNERHGC